MQDVDRCMPENQYFREPATQKLLLDILFIFAKLNPDVGYRQGMHEILAPVLWVVERDAIRADSSSATDESSQDGRGQLLIFDSSYVEHDTFTLFGLIMQNAKTFYEPGESGRRPLKPRSTEPIPPIVLRSRRIINQLLAQVDPDLAAHLGSIDIGPQIYLMCVALNVHCLNYLLNIDQAMDPASVR